LERIVLVIRTVYQSGGAVMSRTPQKKKVQGEQSKRHKMTISKNEKCYIKVKAVQKWNFVPPILFIKRGL
jgi:hypothetical protein